MASGYLKVDRIIREDTNDEPMYVLSLTNYEVKRMFSRMIEGWFAQRSASTMDLPLKGRSV